MRNYLCRDLHVLWRSPGAFSDRSRRDLSEYRSALPRGRLFGGAKNGVGMFPVTAARSPSLAFHEGNVAFSKIIALLPSPGHFPIDFDEICQNIVTFDPADAFSGPEPPPSPFTREMQLFPMKSPHFPPQKHSVLSVGCFSFAVWGGRREPAFTQVLE